MKNPLRKILKSISALIFAAVPAALCAEQDASFAIFPEVEGVKKTDSYDAIFAVFKGAEVPAEFLDKLFAAAKNGDEAAAEALVSNPKLAKRALKFARAFDEDALRNSVKALSWRGGKTVLFFEKGKGKIPSGMNFIELSPKWNPASADTLARMIAQDIKNLKPTEMHNLDGGGISFFSMSNRPVKFEKKPLVELMKNPAFAFYKETQDLFYALDFDAFKKRLCPESAERYNAAYGEFTKERMASEMKDYLKVSKEYLCVWDFASYAMVFFKYANSADVHIGYVLKNKGSMQIANYISQPTAFDKFAVEYFAK